MSPPETRVPTEALCWDSLIGSCSTISALFENVHQPDSPISDHQLFITRIVRTRPAPEPVVHPPPHSLTPLRVPTWVKNEEDEEERGVFELTLPFLALQPFILIPVDTCYFFDGKYKALLGNIRRAPLIPAAQI